MLLGDLKGFANTDYIIISFITVIFYSSGGPFIIMSKLLPTFRFKCTSHNEMLRRMLLIRRLLDSNEVHGVIKHSIFKGK